MPRVSFACSQFVPASFYSRNWPVLKNDLTLIMGPRYNEGPEIFMGLQ